jgi:hypothetical protein
MDGLSKTTNIRLPVGIRTECLSNANQARYCCATPPVFLVTPSLTVSQLALHSYRVYTKIGPLVSQHPTTQH